LGKVLVQYERLASADIDPILSKLATGKLELEIKPDAPPENERKVPPAQKVEQDKEGFTAWGKEVGGLQAGLGFHPGKKRAYSHNETVTLAIRVRNVGKVKVSLQYLKKFFVEEPPTVTDADGRPLSLSSFP
jgi:hypothetical protein